jgi:hypothetical protein
MRQELRSLAALLENIGKNARARKMVEGEAVDVAVRIVATQLRGLARVALQMKRKLAKATRPVVIHQLPPKQRREHRAAPPSMPKVAAVPPTIRRAAAVLQ